MFKKILFFLTFISLILFAGFFLSRDEIKEVEIKGKKFKAEVAYAKIKKEKGLSGREDLCQECAMLFIFSEKDNHIFWMDGMSFDLDIIWINDDRIVHIERSVSHSFPRKKYPGTLSDKVLEINSGLSDRYGFEVGDKVDIL